MLYIGIVILRGRWCNIIVLNMLPTSEEKSDDSKESFYEELESVFDDFLKYNLEIILGNFNRKVGRESIFKPTNRNESLHQDSEDSGDGIVNYATSRNLVVKSRRSRNERFISVAGPRLMKRLTTILIHY